MKYVETESSFKKIVPSSRSAACETKCFNS